MFEEMMEMVARLEAVEDVYWDFYGGQYHLTVNDFEGFDARVMQHEYDHLDGILYTDKCSNLREAPEMDDEDEEGLDEE